MIDSVWQPNTAF